ncbi:hypothetical protein N7537_010233 [Penicillium hordei]|uniref:Uncharacterized protein n=1 Tax=Penicillium hordei TaxID=40994 RepID=A0AAD6DUB3_9EURO|nr:uncharacterized protein N7537_010233 [Penicillium hordei]KAJ5593329.1 hypothetical protein N7537_010233 [Penicillium hordei]
MLICICRLTVKSDLSHSVVTTKEASEIDLTAAQGACAPGIRKVNFVFEVDVKKLKHGIMHSLQYPKT